MALLLEEGGNMTPLLVGRVHTRRVVGGHMEEEDGLVGRVPDGAEHALKVQTDRLGVVIRI